MIASAPSAPADSDWFAVNQRVLLTALAPVRSALTTHADRQSELVEAAAQQHGVPSDDWEDSVVTSALQRICEGFALSPFERDILLLCAGCELDGAFPGLCAAAQGDERRAYPSFGLALAALNKPHWSALHPSAPLRNWRLVEIEAGGLLTTSPLRIDERVLHCLAGVVAPDQRLRGLVEVIATPDQLPPPHRECARQLISFWLQHEGNGNFPVVQLLGQDASIAADLAATAAAAFDLRLQTLRASDVPGSATEREYFARLLEREVILGRCALMVELDGGISPEAIQATASLLDHTQGPLFVCGVEPLRLRTRKLAQLAVPTLGPAEQRQLWREALGREVTAALNGQVDQVACQFQLSPAEIRAAATELAQHQARGGHYAPDVALWDACRSQTRPRLDGLAQRIEALATWNDLVLPCAQLRSLRTIAAHVRQRGRVYEEWGFAARSDRGLGIGALFSGGSGTGKTMAAEVLANELRLDLHRIDLSALVSKYIGETEKNLRQVFDAAEAGGVILLFDEADATFGRRSQVRDSHDRYANIEVGYLLQRIETYRGLVILTTNQPEALDPAFSRRIRFAIHFPFPDFKQRAEIWRRVFPASTPTEGIDVQKLSRLNLAGGQIRNLALNAAFLAADAQEPVCMHHLLTAAQMEFAKLEKPLSSTEIAGWL